MCAFLLMAQSYNRWGSYITETSLPSSLSSRRLTSWPTPMLLLVLPALHRNASTDVPVRPITARGVHCRLPQLRGQRSAEGGRVRRRQQREPPRRARSGGGDRQRLRRDTSPCHLTVEPPVREPQGENIRHDQARGADPRERLVRVEEEGPDRARREPRRGQRPRSRSRCSCCKGKELVAGRGGAAWYR